MTTEPEEDVTILAMTLCVARNDPSVSGAEFIQIVARLVRQAVQEFSDSAFHEVEKLKREAEAPQVDDGAEYSGRWSQGEIDKAIAELKALREAEAPAAHVERATPEPVAFANYGGEDRQPLDDDEPAESVDEEIARLLALKLAAEDGLEEAGEFGVTVDERLRDAELQLRADEPDEEETAAGIRAMTDLKDPAPIPPKRTPAPDKRNAPGRGNWKLSYDNRTRIRTRYQTALEEQRAKGLLQLPHGFVKAMAIEFNCSEQTVRNIGQNRDSF